MMVTQYMMQHPQIGCYAGVQGVEKLQQAIK